MQGYIFNESVMKKYMDKDSLNKFVFCVNNYKKINANLLEKYLKALFDWAKDNNIHYYTHWFFPFFTNGKIKINYIESYNINYISSVDASSFLTGDLRNIYNGKGIIKFDYYSFPFIFNKCLYLPSIFSSINNESLDLKMPLIKSIRLLNAQMSSLLKKLGYNIKRVDALVGIEQELFIIDKKTYENRLDLKMLGKTIIGNNTIINQQHSDHYCGYFNKKVSLFIDKLTSILNNYGIFIKCKHAEAALAQYELVLSYNKINITNDTINLLRMIINDMSYKYDLVCLFDELPFKGLSGSGKHNNYSLVTDSNINLFEYSSNNQLLFLMMIAIFIKAIDENANLLQASFASPSNDERLGGNEAPSYIISISLGKQLNTLINDFINDKPIEHISHINSDRNRTSMIAFSDNKFEFRGLGSNQDICLLNTTINSIIANEVKILNSKINQKEDLIAIIKSYFINHKKVIYEKDCYSSSFKRYVKENKLSYVKNSISAYSYFNNSTLLTTLNVLNKREIKAYYNSFLTYYNKNIIKQAKVMIMMVEKQIYPACIKYLNMLAITLNNVKINGVTNSYLLYDVNLLSNKINILKQKIENVKKAVKKVDIDNNSLRCNNLLMDIKSIRNIVDFLETKIDSSMWIMPTYTDLLL